MDLFQAHGSSNRRWKLPGTRVLRFHPTEDQVSQHEYRQHTAASVEGALRLVEKREAEGWELVSLFPKPVGIGHVGRDFEVLVIVRRAQGRDARPGGE